MWLQGTRAHFPKWSQSRCRCSQSGSKHPFISNRFRGRPASDEQPDVVSLDEERQKRAADSPREPTELEKKLRENVGGSFSRYMRENVDEQERKGGSIPLDGPFEETRSAPSGAVLKSFTGPFCRMEKYRSSPGEGRRTPTNYLGCREPARLGKKG